MDSATRDRITRSIQERIPQNIALGITLVEVTPGVATFELPYDARLIGNPDTGVLHGGVITTLLDGCSGCAVFTMMTELGPIVTIDLRIDYLRPAEPGRTVRAQATCYKMTRNVAFTRAVAYHDDPGDPIASSAGTFMVSARPGTSARSIV